jgi:hypothetical protein
MQREGVHVLVVKSDGNKKIKRVGIRGNIILYLG